MKDNNDIYYMKLALNEAKKAFELDEVPVGAIIVYNGEVIASAYNTKDSSNCVINHAEMLAIRHASKILRNWRLDNCEIYVTLQPCLMCLSAIKQARISRLIYSASSTNDVDNKIFDIYINSTDINKKITVDKGVLSDISVSLLTKFFKNKRNL